MVVLAAGPFGGEIDNDAPIALWKDLLGPYGVKVAGTLLPGEGRYPGAPGEGINGGTTAAPDAANGCALAMLHAGADGIELFNYFPEKVLDNGRGWTLDSFKSTLKAMRSIDTMLPLRRKHFVAGRQCTAHGELICHNPLVNATANACYEMGTGQYPLPAQGHWLAFRLQTGPKPTGRNVHLIIGTEAGQPEGHTLNASPKVLVNDVECAPGSRPDNEHWHRYEAPPEAFADGEHVIEVIAQGAGDSPQIRISRVEFFVEGQ